MKAINRDGLKSRLQKEKPNNIDPFRGYALVNVLDRAAFLDEHIPDSVNIPVGQENEFDKRFDHSKEIILYCASNECSASTTAAKELAARGFQNIITYEGGMKAWKDAGNQLERGEGAAREVRVA